MPASIRSGDHLDVSEFLARHHFCAEFFHTRDYVRASLYRAHIFQNDGFVGDFASVGFGILYVAGRCVRRYGECQC